MKKTVEVWARKFFSCCGSSPGTPPVACEVDVREEYANAFRTESYYHFWARVVELTNNDTATRKSLDSTSAARLSSYRLFAEYLLDPDQPTVTKSLAVVKTRPENLTILSDYFLETANASLFCSHLLKDIDRMRVRYRTLRKIMKSLEITQFAGVNHLPTTLTQLSEFMKSINPFVPSSSCLTRFRAVQASCSGLLRRLELSRDKAQAKLQLLNSLKCGSAIFLTALTATITIIVVSHALATAVAMPAFVAASLELASIKRLGKLSAQLDAAAKGTYILNRDLDTISRLVARLDDELEHIRAMIGFLLELIGEDQIQAGCEVALQLKMNDSSFSEQLDELEEHLYLCFMTINRARHLVMKEVLDSRSSTSASSP